MVVNKEVVGLVYPAPKKVVDRILSNEKTVFVKYPVHEPSKKSRLKVRKGLKLLFYQTKTTTSAGVIVGEANIKDIHFMKKSELSNELLKSLALTEDELADYCKNRENKSLLVLYLSEAVRYASGKKAQRPITKNGLYITNESESELKQLC